MLNSLFLEFQGLFNLLYYHLNIYNIDGNILVTDTFSYLAVGIVGLLAVSVPFVIAIKLINLVCGGLSK